MKKLSLILLSAIVLLTGSCNTWMQDDNFYSDIENDVKVANAKQISVYVRYAMTRQGKTDPDGPTTFKVEIPSEVSATTETEYGFVRWAAFSTSYLATGDNQSKNKDIYFIDEEDYNKRILPNEIQSPEVVFEDPTKATTSVKINVDRDDIFLCPIVAQRPAISLTIPAKGSSGVVRNMSVRINFTKPMDPESFKNEEGVYDKITITQGIQAFSADGDIEITSEDISDRFEPPVFSKNKKMITLKFKQDAINEGYSSQSSVNITIAKDVKDIYGFSMTDDDKISFTVGSYKDTLAPRITQLSAGTNSTNFHSIPGMYKDAVTWNNIQAYTKMYPHLQQDGSYLGAADAPSNNIDAAFYNTLIANRITGKLIIRVYAEDIAGSGTAQSQTGIETDVAMLGIRAFHMYNADGTPSTISKPLSSVTYVPQTNNSTIATGAYRNLINGVNNLIPGTENDLDADKGCLFDYDLSSMPDGLIRIDIAAVDMVQNSGFADGGSYSEEYGDGYASIFVVKDTTAPNVSDNASYVVPNVNDGVNGFFNARNYSTLKIVGNVTGIHDAAHARLGAPHDSMKWIIKPTRETNWAQSITPSDSAWRPVTSDYNPFPPPDYAEGNVYYTYALMDDMGNISSACEIPAIKYDSVAPVVQALTFVADEGNTAGIASKSVLDHQTLVIPIAEETSGLWKIEVNVRKNGSDADYASPFASPNLSVIVDGQPLAANAYSINGKTLTLNTPRTNFNSTVKIKGLKISSAADDAHDALQGTYTFNVKVTDAADNPTSTNANQVTTMSIDSVAPVVDSIYIPNLKKTVRFGSESPEYWVDYTTSSIPAGSTTPRTDVLIKFTEASSGAKIFDFQGSSIHLTSDSVIYKIDPNTAAIDGVAIPSTVDTAANRLIINSHADAALHFANVEGSIIAAKITNVEFAPEGSPSTVAIKIHDTATKVSSPVSTFNSNEGSLNFTNPGFTGVTSFNFNSDIPLTSGNSISDRNGTDTATSGQAESGYTNEIFVNESITFTPKASGIDSFTIIGDAVINRADSDTTTITYNGTPVFFDLSADGKTVTFKKAADDPSHVVLGNGTTAFTLTITNLKITAGDGLKNINIKARSFAGRADPNGLNAQITLDTIAPLWNGIGLYAATHANVNSGFVYPHPIEGLKVYGLTNIDPNASDVIYFYRQSNINIMPDIIDTNKKSANELISYSKNGTAILNNAESFLTTDSGTFTAIACDRAGNKSNVKTFRIVNDNSFAPGEESNIDNYMTLSIPSGTQIHKNTSVSRNGYTLADYYAGNNRNDTSTNTQINYVIKGESSGTDTNYQIKIKLGTGITNTDTAIDGSLTPVGEYSRRRIKTDSSPIEYYAISHWHDNSRIPQAPDNYGGWKEYTTSSIDNTNGDIHSSVDANGDITIKIPNKNCPPLSLFLKDACGNITYRKIKPSTDTFTDNDLAWIVDKEVGLAGTGPSISFTAANAASKIKVPYNSNYTSFSTNFYVSSTPVTISSQESCFFSETTGADENNYSIKSRLIIWNGTGTPARDDFYSNSLTIATGNANASSWNYVKMTGSSSISMQHYLPYKTISDVNTGDNHISNYSIFYIVEDKVGNYVIQRLKWNNNTNSEQKWLYDVIAPKLTVTSVEKANPFGNYYYFSDNTSVTYEVRDNESGVYSYFKNGSSSELTNPRFSYPPTYKNTHTLTGSNIVPDNQDQFLIFVRDYADNSASNQCLTYNGKSQWKKMVNRPGLKTTTIVDPDTCVSTTTYCGASLSSPTNNTITSSIARDTYSSGQMFKIKSMAKNQTISIKLYPRKDDTKSEDSEQLLGWYVSSSAIFSNTDSKGFYSADDIANNNSTMGITLTYNNNNTDKSWTCTYDKGNTTSPWHNYRNNYYLYPVNRAGMMGYTPIKIVFENNPIPSISSAGITYDIYESPTTANPFPSSTITTYGSGTDTVNYTKTGAKIRFTTVNNPVSCRFYYGNGNNFINYTSLAQYRVDTDTYELPLDYDTLKSLSPELPYKLKLFTTIPNGSEVGEESAYIELLGPANNNKWTFDDTKPVMKIGSSANNIKSSDYPSSGQSSDAQTKYDIKYIQSDTAKITFTRSSTDTDIAHYQWKRSTSGTTGSWEDIPSSYYTTTSTSLTLTFDAPDARTSYEFRAVDKAGNISESLPYSSTADYYTTVEIQKDKWAPDAPGGSTPYKTFNGTEEVVLATILDQPYNGNENDRVIKYSTIPSNPNYINKLFIDLSVITDDVDGIARSGLEGIYLSGDGVTYNKISASPKEYPLATTYNNKILSFKAIDNLGQERTLKTFRLTADSQPPALSLSNVKTYDAATPADLYTASPVGSGAAAVYYLKNNKIVINFATDDETAKYEWNIGNGSFVEIPAENKTLTASSLAVTIDTPDAQTSYSFKASDLVGNTSATITLKLAKDYAEPAGAFSYSLKNGSNAAASENFIDTAYNSNEEIRSILYNSNNVTAIDFDFSGITDEASGIKNFYIQAGTNSPVAITATSSPSLRNDKHCIFTLGNNWSDSPYVISVKDNAGHERILKSFRLTADGSAPNFTLAAEHPVQAQSSGSSVDSVAAGNPVIHYLNGDNAIIHFATTTAGDIEKYQQKIGDGEWTDITLTDMVLTFTSPETATTYYFRAVDKVKNYSDTITLTLKKDIAAPAGDFSFTLKNGDSEAASENFINTAYNSNEEIRSILYNSNNVTAIDFDFSGITDVDSGIENFYIKAGDSSPTAISLGNDKHYNFTLGNDWSDSPYVFSVKDNAGHERILKSFRLTADGSAPNFTLAAEHPVQTKSSGNTYDSVALGNPEIHYLRRDNAIIHFATTTTLDIEKYQQKIGEGEWTDITLTDMVLTFTSPETATTYNFRAVDKVKNYSAPITLTLKKDRTGPSGSLSFSLTKDDDLTPVAEAYYTTSVDTAAKTTTITFNPAYINKIIFNTDGITDAGSGFDKLVQKINNTETDITESKTISLADNLNNVSYQISAEDKCENSTDLWTYIFTADSTGPTLGTSYYYTNSSRNILKGYTPSQTLSKAKDNQLVYNYESNIYSSGLTISYPIAAITGAVKYQIVVTEPDTSSNYNLVHQDVTAAPDGWLDIPTDNAETPANYVFPIPDVTVPHCNIALFLKDAVGNVSESYIIGGNGNQGKDTWWIIGNTITAENISVTTQDWSSETQAYNISVTLPDGAVVTSVTAQSAQVGNISFAYESYWNGQNAAPGWLYISSMTVPLTNVTSADAKISINGIEVTIFNPVAGGGGNGANGGGDPSPNMRSSGGIFDNFINKLTGKNKAENNSSTRSSYTPSYVSTASDFYQQPEAKESALTSDKKTSKSNKTKKSSKKSKKAAAEKEVLIQSEKANEIIIEQSVASGLESIAAVKAEVPEAVTSAVSPVMTEASASEGSLASAGTSSELSPASQAASEESSSPRNAIIVIIFTALAGAAAGFLAYKRRKVK